MADASATREKSVVGPWVAFVLHRPGLVSAVFLATTVLLGAYALTHLGVNSDNPRMMPADMPERIHFEAFNAVFPTLENAMLVAVDGETPEIAREAAKQLAAAIRADPEHFHDVDIPGAGEFFERHGLLYQPLEDLEVFVDQIVTIQPLLASLEREPTLGNLLSLIEEGLEATDGPLDTPEEWTRVLDRFSEATVKVYAEYPIAISWEDLALEGTPVESQTRYVLIVDPVLEFTSVFPAGPAMEEVRRLAGELGFGPGSGVRVRITGHPPLNHEEIQGVLWDVIYGVCLFLGLVLLVLRRALASWRMVFAAVATLVSGLVWTAAFAGWWVGDLSLPSLTFAIFFVGLGVDFTIHLGMAYASSLYSGLRPEEAMLDAVGTVGNSFLMCTLTTSLGFFVFIPTQNLAIAELGMISGSGMIINLFVSITLFPALMASWLRLEGEQRELPRFRLDSGWRAALDRNPGRVATLSFVGLVVAAASATRIDFDDNVLNLRAPDTESVQLFEELVDESGERSPWPIDALASDLEAADAMADRLEALDVVASAVHLGDYVPDDQDDKLDILADLGFLLDSAPPALAEVEPRSTEEQIEALREFRDYLATAAPAQDSSMSRSMEVLEGRLSEFLERADADPAHAAEALATLEALLLSGVPGLFEQLRLATEVDPITLDRLPHSLTRRMLAEDGRARVQIFPKEVLRSDEAFMGFANDVKSVVPTASGVAVNMIALGRATRDSFRQAIASALFLISVTLLLLWKRVTPVAMVLTALCMVSIGTIGVMAALGMPLNLLNVLVIPLLIGIGVDSGIHLVHRADHPARSHENLIETTTARAVFFSALTTAMSFGTLAFSSHRGVSSLGVALSIGMLLIVVCNLAVLPALLALRRGRAG